MASSAIRSEAFIARMRRASQMPRGFCALTANAETPCRLMTAAQSVPALRNLSVPSSSLRSAVDRVPKTRMRTEGNILRRRSVC